MSKILNFIRRPVRYTYWNLNLYLIGTCVVLFILTMISPKTVNFYLGLYPPAVIQNHFYWQFLTYMFMHGGISHLFFNMLALFFFGTPVEQRMGSTDYSLFYFFTGIAAGLFSFLIYWLTGQNVLLVGASGAIFGVLLAFATYFPEERIFLFGVIPIPAYALIVIYAAIEILSMGSVSNVAHMTHLAGFGFAWIYLWLRMRINPLRVIIDTFKNRRR